jgi:IPT/TIG domain/Domain of unknown function (DUF5122) beta-propeller
MFRKMSLSLLSAAVVAGTVVMLVPQAALALSVNPDPGIWGVKGKVYSLAHANNVVYAGGTFKTVLGPGGQKGAVLNLAAFKESTGTWIPTFAATVENSTGKPVKVGALALSPDGSTLYLGGQFDTVDGQPVNNFAGVDAVTGAFNPSIDFHTNAGAVDVILTGPNLVYIGGAFTKVNSEDRGHLAAMNFDGTLNETWAPTTAAGNCPSQYYNANTCSDGGNGTVRSLMMSADGNTVFVGGEFYWVNGTTSGHERNCIARVSAADGSLDPWAVPFQTIIDDAQTHKPGPNMLWKMALYPASNPTTIIGAFGRVPNYVQAFHLDHGNTGDNIWKVGTSGNDESMSLSPDGTRLFIGGHFGTAVLDQQFCGQWVHGLYSLNPASPTGSVYCDWFPALRPFGGQNAPGHGQSPPNYVGGWASFVDGNALWVGGYFTSVNGVAQFSIARFTIVGSPPPPPPYISGFTPTQGPVGTVVTISGAGFTGTTQVSFGAVNATYTVVNDGQVTATVPDGAVTAPITVVAPGGSVDTGLKNFHVTA